MVKSSLWDYSDAYILAKGITITGAGDDVATRQADERIKGVMRFHLLIVKVK